MKKLILLFVTIGCCFSQSMAQMKPSDLVKEMNRTITLYGADNGELITLHEAIGVLEQKTTTKSFQRIKISDIGFIQVVAKEEGSSVTFGCADSMPCINIIKPDMSSSGMPSSAFFFMDAKSANSFAKLFEGLLTAYPSGRAAVKAQLAIEQDALEDKPKSNASRETKPKATPVTKQETEDKEDIEEEAAVKKTTARKTTKKEAETGDDEQEEKAERKETGKRTRELREEQANEPDAANEKNEDPGPGMDAQCRQLVKIFAAGKDAFKSIEGKQTNADLKINESMIRLKGAKRSYLSWYKNKRAFIAEFKTLADRDLILEEFVKVQTQLEDCLEGNWDNTDHSSDDMYANTEEEVKDVEYKLDDDPQMPSMRIMISTDKAKRHTLFVRIQ